MLRSQRRRRRIKRPSIINSLKRKAGQKGQVIDPTKFLLPVPVPVFPSSPLSPLSSLPSLPSLPPVRDMSREFNPTMRRYHSTNRANSNSSQGSMGDFPEIVNKAFPGKTQEEIRDFVKTVTENRRDFEKRVTSQKEFRETVNKALPDISRVERRKLIDLVTDIRTTPRRQVSIDKKRLTRMLRRVRNVAGKKSRKRRK
jgi:hypothetical protein